jgi:dolichol-phosphate mannosyltransferase
VSSEIKNEVIPIRQPRKQAPKSVRVIVPCYNEEAVFPELLQRLTHVLDNLDVPCDVLFVDDGSSDASFQLAFEASAADERFSVIRLSRNFGHQIAISCGLDNSDAEVVVIMDADLQDPPELIPDMISLWTQGYDVVYGQRSQRSGESAFKRLCAYAFYRVINSLTGINIPVDTGDFRLMDRRAVDAFCRLGERQRFVRGMVTWIGFHQTALVYQRPIRAAGDTKYPFRKSLLLAIDAITSFSYAPLRLASWLGFGLSVVAFLYIVFVIGLKIAGINFRGYTSLMGAILLLGGVQLIVLGVIGEYLGRIYEEVKKRPLYYVDRRIGRALEGAERDRDL